MYSYMGTKNTCVLICWDAGWDLGLTAFFLQNIFASEKEKQKM